MGLLYLSDSNGNYRCSEIDYDFNDTYDAMNSEHTRNDETEMYDDYNCFGFALGTYNWGSPFISYDFLEDLKDEGIIDDYDITDYEQEMIGEIISISDEVFNAKISEEAAGQVCEVIMRGDFSDTFALEIAKRHMLSAFSDLRAIGSFDELEDDEYGIVYAAGDWDFHYAKYYPEFDEYVHKVGRLDPEIETNEDDVFGERYNSKRLYFAKKRINDICMIY